MRRALIPALCLVLLMAGQVLASVQYYPPGPVGTIGVSRPRLGMRVQVTDQDRVLQATVTLDGNTFPAAVDGDLYYFQPAQPLAPGPHSASIHVVLAGNYQPLDQTWQFSVAPDAMAELPAPGPAQLAALDAVNTYRRLADLAPVALDPALNAAAQAHARYFILNPTRGLSAHYEQQGSVGFTGAAPWDRGAYFGFLTAGSYQEDMDFVSDHRQAVQDWADSVYHRFLIIDPDLTVIGYGFARDGSGNFANVLDGGARLPSPLPGVVQAVVYPMPGQRGVPVDWDDHEVPDPLRSWNATGSGYPLTLQFAARNLSKVTISSATLTDPNGGNVPLWVNTPDSDEHLKNQVALLPQASLAPGTRYTVTVAGNAAIQDGSSKPFRKTWWFTTRGAADRLVANAGVSVMLNGLPMLFDVSPAIENDRTMVPFRALFEALGAGVAWDPQRYDVIAQTPLHTIRLKIGNDRALVDGQDVLLDAAPVIISGRTLVPLRFVAETLGLKVGWDAATRTVTLTAGP